MKKVFFMTLLCLATVGASAQKNWTVWFGINLADVDVSGHDTETVAQGLNLGVQYTQAIKEKFDWSAGLSYQTKGFQEHGGTWSPGVLQLDGNVGWNALEAGKAKIGLVTGPYLTYLAVKDGQPDAEEFGLGWQLGARATFRSFIVSAGYEYTITDAFDSVSGNQSNIYIRLGWRF